MPCTQAARVILVELRHRSQCHEQPRPAARCCARCRAADRNLTRGHVLCVGENRIERIASPLNFWNNEPEHPPTAEDEPLQPIYFYSRACSEEAGISSAEAIGAWPARIIEPAVRPALDWRGEGISGYFS